MNDHTLDDNPLSVTCPKCSASIDYPCMESKKDGSYQIETPHQERIDKVKQLNLKHKKDHGFPEAVEQFFKGYFK